MRAALLAALCLLSACAQQSPSPASAPSNLITAMPAWDAARAAGVDFRAIGQEPGWILDLYAARLALTYDYGEQALEAPLPEPSYPVEGQTRYDTRTQDGRAVRVTIQRYPCQDAMSGENYPARVTVTIDAHALEGCGKTL